MTDQYGQPNINQAIPRGTRAVTATGNILRDDDIVAVDTTGGIVTLTLFSADEVPGQVLVFKANNAGTTGNGVVITATVPDTIDGLASVSLQADNQVLMIKSDGTNWRVITGTAQTVLPESVTVTSVAPQIIASGASAALVGMTITPGAGTWNVWFDGDYAADAITTTSTVVIRVNAVAQAVTLRNQGTGAADDIYTATTIGRVTTAAAQAIDVFAAAANVGNITWTNRTLMISRVSP